MGGDGRGSIGRGTPGRGENISKGLDPRPLSLLQRGLAPRSKGMKSSIPGLGRSPGEGNDNPVFLPGKSHGHRSLAGVDYSPRGRKESDMT